VPTDRLELTEYLDRFSELIERGKTVLDVGCGDGLPVDRYLVGQGLAVNGIDASARMIELARTNVPEAFYEVKDVFELKEAEYCVDGIVSLRALIHFPRESYHALLKTFGSFMSNGGALLLAMRSDALGRAREDGHGVQASPQRDDASDNAELIEDAGFSIIVSDIAGPGDMSRQIILARS
jgi:cyclopropane fatty-acyl-phospholipid synthase-like methyltransferase